MTAPGSAPGFDGGLMSYPVSTDSPGPMSANQADQDLQEPSGAMAAGKDSPFPQAGKFGQEQYGDAAMWKKTPSSG